MARHLLCLLTLSFWLGTLHAVELPTQDAYGIKYTENKGQWNDQVLYRADIQGGVVFLEKQAFTWAFRHKDDVRKLHDFHHGHKDEASTNFNAIRSHAFKTILKGSNSNPIISRKLPSSGINNYFLGDDPTKWASNVRHFHEIQYAAVYPGIDLKVYSLGPDLKYDFIVAPGAQPDQIQLEYEGVDKVWIRDGKLHLLTSVNEIVEQTPYAYQMIKGRKKQVDCQFQLKGNVVRFKIGSNYNPNYELVIDPRLVFSTYSGSTSDNWGSTATYDRFENLYAGGVTFGANYPTTTGAFSEVFSGGDTDLLAGFNSPFDITITKFSPDGTSILYSTFLGGSGNEFPHSLVVNNNDELIILGTSSSDDFPTPANSYDDQFNGGSRISAVNLLYKTGSDIVLAKLSLDGSSLLGSTYIGGSKNDGLNKGPGLGTFSYGDVFRGEIVTDNTNNIYVAASTNSLDFPVTNGVFQPISGGIRDGVVFKFNDDLSSLIWSSYLGGTVDDAAYSIQLNSQNEIYVAGGTTSTFDFPATNGALNSNGLGDTDGFLAKISNDGQQLLDCTYLGTNTYDQAFFVQIDDFDFPYVLGQTEGHYTVTQGVYSNPNSGQFIHKLSKDLSQTEWSTVVGTGSGHVDLTLTAFLVNHCGQIFMSGWGGNVNSQNGYNSHSTTHNLPITADAFQATTDGSDFYLMVLDTNASDTVFCSYFGGGTSEEHCDGGTSRFDKNGTVYQAVCAGCGGNSDFPTSGGAWSNTNNSSNCNLAAFKFDISDLTARIGFETPSSLCLPEPVAFENLSTGGLSFKWFFGDGDNSDLFEPTHDYSTPDTFQVMLVVYDSTSSSCNFTDTAFKEIVTQITPRAIIDQDVSACDGDPAQLIGINSLGGSFSWTPTTGLDDPNAANPIATIDKTTTYTLEVENDCGIHDTSLVLTITYDNTSIMPDTSVCGPQVIPLSAFGGAHYNWNPKGILSNENALSQITATINETTVISLTITDPNGCVWEKEATVFVHFVGPEIATSADTSICRGDTIWLNGSGGSKLDWTGPRILTATDSNMIQVVPYDSSQYQLLVTNGCGQDSSIVGVVFNQWRLPEIEDQLTCPDTEIELDAGVAATYNWSPEKLLDDPEIRRPTARIRKPVQFTVIGTNNLGCLDTVTFEVDTLDRPYLDLGRDDIIEFGDPFLLTAIGDSGLFEWHPNPLLPCINCREAQVLPLESTTFYGSLTDPFGCITSDSIRIRVEGGFFAPNTFTPNNDGKNDVFFVYGKELHNFQLAVYNRWGENIFHTNDINVGWNGQRRGVDSPIGTYSWKVQYTNLKGQLFYVVGHVNLVR